MEKNHGAFLVASEVQSCFIKTFTLLVLCWYYALVVWLNQFWCCFCLLSLSSETVLTLLLSKYYFKLQVQQQNYSVGWTRLWFSSDFSRPCWGNLCNAVVCSAHPGGCTQSTCAGGRGSPGKGSHASGHTQLFIHTLSFPVFPTFPALPFVSVHAGSGFAALCLSLQAAVRMQRASLQQWHSCTTAFHAPHS